MSKIPADFLKKSINDIFTNRKQRKFVESVELQIGLRDYDADKRINGSVKLPYQAYKKLKVCVMANALHIGQCQEIKVPYIDLDGMKAFNKDKVKIRKWAKKYDFILASDSISKQVIKVMGNALVKLGKYPIALDEGEDIQKKIEEVKHTVKFQSKKIGCLGIPVGNITTGEDKVRQNLTMAINFLVSLLKKGWQNVGTLHIKTTMGKPIRIFG